MSKFIIEAKDRDIVINFLNGLVVPAPIGAEVVNVVNFLRNLPALEDEKPEKGKSK